MGSTFTIDVPLAKEAAQTESSRPSSIPSQGERRIEVLLVDDDAAVADSLFMVLTGAGLRAISASDGNEAIKQCSDGLRPDLILSDYRMPNENGLIVVDRLRRALGYQAPAIIMTGDTSLRHIEEQRVANLTVVQKPVDPDILINLIYGIASASAQADG